MTDGQHLHTSKYQQNKQVDSRHDAGRLWLLLCIAVLHGWQQLQVLPHLLCASSVLMGTAAAGDVAVIYAEPADIRSTKTSYALLLLL
jgi:hypothetical protein